MRTAVVGCGPSGLLAAHALVRSGFHPAIYTDRKKMSPLGGAMYLHRAIPGLTHEVPDGYIEISKMGTAEGYARKVYKDPNHPVSFNQFAEGFHPMWSLRDAYAAAWDMYRHHLIKRTVDAGELARLAEEFDLILYTAPKWCVCYDRGEHQFNSATVWIREIKTYDGRSLPASMIYSGDWADTWYRRSQIDSITTWEYGSQPDDRPGKVFQGKKPTTNTCECWAEAPVKFMGRFGAWRKGVLTHHVYEETLECVAQIVASR